MTPPEDARLVDARGTRCPVPVIRVARAVRDLPPGSVVVLLADDVAARSDVPAWARMRGHDLEMADADEEGTTTYRVVTGGGQAEKST